MTDTDPDDPGLPEVAVGHWTDERAQTGCTVILLPDGTTASAEVRGGAPATRELDVLAPDRTVTRIDAVLLTGGSAFGLAAADGVMRFCEERGRGVPTPGGPVPIVPTLGLFDLAVGAADVRPGPDQGYAAAATARAGVPETGPVGAGTGARTSHWRGPEGQRPGGFRYAEVRAGSVVVAAYCAVNAFGDVDDGVTSEDAATDPSHPDLLAGLQQTVADRTHTTIGLVVTNARLDKTGCFVVAQGAHDGLARSLFPAHTRFDGDAFVAAATGQVDAHLDVVRMLAVRAVERAVRSARSALS